MISKPSINYLNNEEFYKRICEWKESGDDTIPDDIALNILKICENLSKSGKFVGYTWRSEMVEDAVLSCIKFCRNFDPTKSKNPFAYYTQIAYNAFIKRISIENQKLAAMAEYRDQIMSLYDVQEDCDDDSDNRYGNIENTAKRINRTYIKQKKVKKSNQKSIDDFCD